MKKRGVFFTFVVFLLILAPNVFSIYKENIYSGTVEDGDIINISGKIFKFKIDPISSKTLIQIDISAIIVNNGECKIKDKLHICVKNVSFSYRNYTIWNDVYKALVDVYQIKSTLDVVHTVEKSNLLIGEETIVELSFENTADIVAEDVKVTVNVPSSLLVTETDGCKKTSSGILFEANVGPRQIRKCTYKIKGINPGEFELRANGDYFDGAGKSNISTVEVEGKVYNYSLRIIHQPGKSKFDIGERLNLTISIENLNDEYDLIVTSLITKIPEKLLLLKKPRETAGNNRIVSWSGTLSPKENKSFTLELQSMITNNYLVLTEASYKVSKFSRKAKRSSNIEVYCNCPYIEHEFSQGIVVPEQRAVLKAYMINPITANHFKNVKINYVTDVPGIQDFSTAYSRINPGEIIKIFDSSVISPGLGEAYYVNITANYESQGNQIFIARDNIIIKVPQEEEPEINITEEVEEETKEEVEAEEQQKVSLEAEEPGSTVEETEGEKEAEDKELPVTTIKSEKKTPIKAYAIVAIILLLIFFLTMVVISKKRRSNGEIEEKDEIKKEEIKNEFQEEKKQKIKGFLSNLFGKKEKKSEYREKEESEYKQLEKEVKELGNILEKQKK